MAHPPRQRHWRYGSNFIIVRQFASLEALDIRATHDTVMPVSPTNRDRRGRSDVDCFRWMLTVELPPAGPQMGQMDFENTPCTT